MYEAIVCHIKTRPHPNADRVQLGAAAGYQVVVGLDTEDGALGVYFPVDGALSHEFCMARNLYRKNPETGEEMGGYFEANRRVRAQKFRGSVSEGYWTPVENLAWTGVDVSTLKAGDTITTLNGKLVCEKYETPATKQARDKQMKQGKPKFSAPLKRHFDTKHLRRCLGQIPYESVVYVTEKLHGTSGRTGYLKVKRGPKSKFKRFVNRVLGTSVFKDTVEYEKITGSRNVVFDPESSREDHFRQAVVRDLRLHKGETFYYEIVGYENTGAPIMSTHKLSDKGMKKKYGDTMVYNYGQEEGTCEMYVYRITHTTEEGKEIELSWPQVKARCAELGVKHVPELGRFMVFDNPFNMKNTLDTAIEKWDAEEERSTLDPLTLMEGVCFRVEHEELTTIFKMKHFQFKVLEGIAKNDPRYVDTEEVA